MKISFNQPYLTGKETEYIVEAVNSLKISGNGTFTKRCQDFFEQRYSFLKTLLTSSCTDALEMTGILMNIKPGDEVILPSFTFVSVANAFALRGARLVFADSSSESPNIDPEQVESLVTSKTKAIIVVHYAGVACEMDKILSVARKFNLIVVEDCAHAVDSFYKNKPLGSLGTFGTFSFHETKNLISGEGGMLTINDSGFIERAEIVWEKGTNRAAFFRGEKDKYDWIDLGSSFLPSEVTAAFLFAQIENIEVIQRQRKKIWHFYNERFADLEKQGKVKRPFVPAYATVNGNMFYLLTGSYPERSRLIQFLEERQIRAVFHYQPLHKSPYYLKENPEKKLQWADYYNNCLVRLPFFYKLSQNDQEQVVEAVYEFYKQ